MKLYTELTDIHKLYPKLVVALGTFDGIHYAHKSIIAHAAEKAARINGTSAVFTFSNHPLALVSPQRCPPQIITQTEKVRLISSLGIKVLFNIPFTEDFLQWPPEHFIDELLRCMEIDSLVVGPNYSYGYKGSGTSATLQQAGRRDGFAVDVIPAVMLDGLMVSSTNIRKMIAAGDIARASHFLGRPVAYEGQIVSGDCRGRTLGYPTANIAVEASLVLPLSGVYAVRIFIDGQVLSGVANVGVNPTFPDERRKRIEVHIFDFDRNVYGDIAKVVFLQRIRDEIKFASAQELIAQIHDDICRARDFCCEA